jgi:hypothetical protein
MGFSHEKLEVIVATLERLLGNSATASWESSADNASYADVTSSAVAWWYILV